MIHKVEMDWLSLCRELVHQQGLEMTDAQRVECAYRLIDGYIGDGEQPESLESLLDDMAGEWPLRHDWLLDHKWATERAWENWKRDQWIDALNLRIKGLKALFP